MTPEAQIHFSMQTKVETIKSSDRIILHRAAVCSIHCAFESLMLNYIKSLLCSKLNMGFHFIFSLFFRHLFLFVLFACACSFSTGTVGVVSVS